MSYLLSIPNELLDEIASHLGPLEISHLLATCHSLSARLAPAMYQHAIAPKGDTHALHWAAEAGHLPLLKLLVTVFPIDHLSRIGGTALQTSALARNNPLILEHLLLHGAHVNHIDDCGLTAIHYACERRTATAEAAETTVRILIAHGANVNTEGRTPSFVPLRVVLNSHFLNVARVLLEAGADPNWRDHTDDALILTFAREGYTQAVELLLEFGAEIDCHNDHHSNALLLASQYGHRKTVKLLIEKGANLQCQDNDEDTPLILAIGYGRLDIAEYLLGVEGVDIQSPNSRGDTPLHLAAWGDRGKFIETLLEMGSPVDAVNRAGFTALHIAVRNGSESIVMALLEKGANTEIAHNHGDTALVTATIGMHLSIAEILIAHGANQTGMSETTALQTGGNDNEGAR